MYATLGGDAAVVINDIDTTNLINDQSADIYCYELLPLDFTLPAIPLKYELFGVGAAPPYVRDRFDQSISALEQLNIKVIFKAVDGEVTMNPWFTKIFDEFLDNALQNLSFEEIIEEAMSHTP